MQFDAHGIGGAQDLPIPAEYAIAGACAALAISFTVLALAWREPQFEVEEQPAPRAPGALRWLPVVARALGFAFFLFIGSAAVLGEDTLTNPVFGTFYVLLWVGIVPLSLAFGPFYKTISPVRTINLLLARVSGSDPDVGLRAYPARLGYWPAVLGLLAFVWMELIYPFGTELGPLRLWCASYVAVMLIGGAVWGNDFYEHADPFEVFSTFVGHLAPWRVVDGRLAFANPLANLAGIPIRPGIVAVCAVLLGSTAFDSFKSSELWLSRVQNADVSLTWLNLIAMLTLITLVGLLFTGATMATGVHDGHRRWSLPGEFAHSLVPIVVGYFFAHYLSYLVEQGQMTMVQMGDPYQTGANVLGLGDRAVNYWLSFHPTLLSVSKVLGVVVGHVVAVVAAHDTAIRMLPRRHQLSGQLPLLFVMVSFTVGGLYLLFGA